APAKAKLSWIPGAGVKAHKVFFGTDADNLKYVGRFEKGDSSEVILPKLQTCQKYFWQVDAEKSDGSMIKGKLWSFYTGKMVVRYKFDETDGEITPDSSGNNLHGKLVGDAHIISDPVRGDVLNLDGDGDYVEVKNLGLKTNSVTFMAWINGWKVDDWAGIVFHRSGSDRDELACGMSFGNYDTLHYTWNDNDQTTYNWEGGPVIPKNKWAMVAVAIEPSKATAYICTETDGLQKGVNNIPHIQQSINSVMIGWDDHSHFLNRRFCGKMDDVRIYNYALSEDEIRAIYTGKDPVSI
ncbi:MAG: LamG domain-containing protein, partial [Candidatus Hodarchaeota archaeon]